MSVTGRTDNHRLQQKCPLLQTPAEGSRQSTVISDRPPRAKIYITSPSRDPPPAGQENSASEKPSSPQTLTSLQWTFSQTTPLNSSFFPIKKRMNGTNLSLSSSPPSLSFVGLAYGCVIAGLFWTIILFYSQINTRFAGKITGHFKVNSGYEALFWGEGNALELGR